LSLASKNQRIQNRDMLRIKNISLLALLTLMIAGISISDVNAQRKYRKKTRKTVVVKKTPRAKVVYVNPRKKVKSIKVLPAGSRIVKHRGVSYHYRDGLYYKYSNANYVVVRPPLGIRIAVLPVGYHRMRVRGITYYYSRGVFYAKKSQSYELVKSPVGVRVAVIPDTAEKITIDESTYYEYADTIYRLVETGNGLEYEVIGEVV